MSRRFLSLLLWLAGVSCGYVQEVTQDLTVESIQRFRAPAGANAQFRLWVPDQTVPVRYVIVLTAGWSGDGRGMAGDKRWQGFARDNHAVLIACRLTGDNPRYTEARAWSGTVLIYALEKFAEQVRRPEIGSVPLLFWGMSAGGQFNYNFACWRPQRVAAFVLNKSAIHLNEPTPGMLKVPGLFVAGERDLDRGGLIAGAFVFGRRRGAPWCMALEPGVGHDTGRSDDLGRAFFKGIMAMRDHAGNAVPWEGSLSDHAIAASVDAAFSKSLTSWLPDQTFAGVWQRFCKGNELAPEKP